jgi:hypothetical protein
VRCFSHSLLVGSPKSQTQNLNPQNPNQTTRQLKVLAEEFGADLAVRDRWGLTPLEEARRGGAAAAAAYLERVAGRA